MEVGTGIAISSATLGIVAVIFKLFSYNRHCEDHTGICVDIKNFTAWLNKIEAKLDKVIAER